MPLVSFVSQEKVEQYQKLLENLEKKLRRCRVEVKNLDLYVFETDNYDKKGRAAIAVAVKDNWCALYAPKELSEEQLGIFELFLRNVDKGDKVIVFTHRDYKAARKGLCGKRAHVRWV